MEYFFYDYIQIPRKEKTNLVLQYALKIALIRLHQTVSAATKPQGMYVVGLDFSILGAPPPKKKKPTTKQKNQNKKTNPPIQLSLLIRDNKTQHSFAVQNCFKSALLDETKRKS